MIRPEIRWASLILAYCSGVYVLASIVENESQLKELVDWYEIGSDWLALQALCAALLAVGSLYPRRSWLHIGLVLSMFSWSAMFVTLAQDLDFSPPTFLMPGLAAFSFVLFCDDVRRGPHV